MSIEKHTYRENGEKKTFLTTSDFWECDCSQGFYHIKDGDFCPACGATADECPDARADEMLVKLNASSTKKPSGPA